MAVRRLSMYLGPVESAAINGRGCAARTKFRHGMLYICHSICDTLFANAKRGTSTNFADRGRLLTPSSVHGLSLRRFYLPLFLPLPRTAVALLSGEVHHPRLLVVPDKTRPLPPSPSLLLLPLLFLLTASSLVHRRGRRPLSFFADTLARCQRLPAPSARRRPPSCSLYHHRCRTVAVVASSAHGFSFPLIAALAFAPSLRRLRFLLPDAAAAALPCIFYRRRSFSPSSAAAVASPLTSSLVSVLHRYPSSLSSSR